MIDSLHGRLLRFDPDMLLQVGPVNFRLLVSGNAQRYFESLTGEFDVPVHLQVREDRLILFGFSSREERALFMKLISISGVGGKLALAILSHLNVAELAAAVAVGDIKRLEAIPGVGKKTASRLALELKGKIDMFLPEGGPFLSPESDDPRIAEAVLALTALGLSRQAALAALAETGGEDLSVEEMIKLALQQGARARGR